jgi:BMFP domain-containing protein YqiC
MPTAKAASSQRRREIRLIKAATETARSNRPDQTGDTPSMSDRPKFFDDLAGVAGGAISAIAGLREEAEAMLRARLDDLIQRLDLVRREELEAIQELAANARAGQEAAETKAGDLETRLAALEARVAALEAPDPDAIPAEGL